jgi:creatinine amidohydrolase
MKLPVPSLCVADDATFWPWLSWPDFAQWTGKDRTVVVIPIAGLADWGLGEALDAEETVLMNVLRAASLAKPADLRLLVLPPVRFVLGPEPGCAFAVDPDVACDLLEEVIGSVAAAGFSRIVLFNASPWNEELCKAVGRDQRIARGLQMFCVPLSGLGLDFHPVRGGDRSRLKAVLASLDAAATGGTPARTPATAAAAAGAAHPVPPGPRPDSGSALLAATAARLAAILVEIRDQPPLAHGGALPPVSFP